MIIMIPCPRLNSETPAGHETGVDLQFLTIHRWAPAVDEERKMGVWENISGFKKQQAEYSRFEYRQETTSGMYSRRVIFNTPWMVVTVTFSVRTADQERPSILNFFAIIYTS